MEYKESIYEYMAVSLTRAAREIVKYKLDLLGIQEVRWDMGGTTPAGYFAFFG
jgi:hypothetical protein